MSETKLLQLQFGVVVCIRVDLSGLKLLHLCMNFKIIEQSCFLLGVEVPFETFVQIR